MTPPVLPALSSADAASPSGAVRRERFTMNGSVFSTRESKGAYIII